MSGLVFLVCVPTAAYEAASGPPAGRTHRTGRTKEETPQQPPPMEKVLEELLSSLSLDTAAVWSKCRSGNFYQVTFPVSAGDQCENTLHFLSELGFGRRLNSLVSVLPCSVFKQSEGIEDEATSDGVEGPADGSAKGTAWAKFVDSVRSKLTVAQVVDGVRSSGELTFDFVLLVVTAGMVAAMGLVENSSVNIVAAMLISPLMGPIVTATFGVVIADRRLQLMGVRTELTGLGLCLVFGFIFGLIIGSAENPWGTADWPTTEMKGRGNYRSLWTGILVALPSGTGVALALLAGSAGPLIGVAISASLLPPVVNCGMMWGLACNVLMYPDTVRIPYIEGESLANWTSTYEPLYSHYIPSELAILGCISFCLTLVNIACIFIAAIIVLKVKEVAAPYTSSPDMRRFWEHDIKVTREYNRSVMLQHTRDGDRNRDLNARSVGGVRQAAMERRLEDAVREAVADRTFQKVRRVSYFQQSTPEVTEQLLRPRGRPLSMLPPPPAESDRLRRSLLRPHTPTPPAPHLLTRLSRSLHLNTPRRPAARASLLPPDASELPTIEEGGRGRSATTPTDDEDV
ncbi:uncharacterized protein LOC124164460 [Ischnura elegans]|uniref:uncharacterized protein LOC124164460 n=1 Tax=Ischnura elegans TaxID=197161 RepID=UPI001ED8AFF9|nr:uncharacterized protein LOC124164460 [Ischnura elegans]